MGICPVCKTRQAYWKLLILFFFGTAKISCRQCKSDLEVDRKRMVAFFLILSTIAISIGMAMGLTGMYQQWAFLAAIWIVCMMLVYPFVVKLKAVDIADPK